MSDRTWFNSTRACTDRRMMKACSRCEVMAWQTVASFCVQCPKRAGNRFPTASSPVLFSHLQARSWWLPDIKGELSAACSSDNLVAPLNVAKHDRLCTHYAHAEKSTQCRRCTNLRSKRSSLVPKSLMPKPPKPLVVHTFFQGTRYLPMKPVCRLLIGRPVCACQSIVSLTTGLAFRTWHKLTDCPGLSWWEPHDP